MSSCYQNYIAKVACNAIFNLRQFIFVTTMPLTHDQRVQVVTLQEQGWTYRHLATLFHVRPATISDLVAKYRRTGSVDDLPRTGRPRASTIRQDRVLTRLSSTNPRTTARGLRQQWQQECGVNVSTSTVKRRLACASNYGYIARKKPLLAARHWHNRVL